MSAFEVEICDFDDVDPHHLVHQHINNNEISTSSHEEVFKEN